MNRNIPYRSIIILWLAWAIILSSYQIYVSWRMVPQGPDYGLSWTPTNTTEPDQDQYLQPGQAFIDQHNAWDSEYYLSIAMHGYKDPAMRAVPENYSWNNPQTSTNAQHPEWISMNYAFFPFYPFMIRLFSYPLNLFPIQPFDAAVLAGVLVSLLGTLTAMIAIYDIARDRLEESGAMRAVFYLLIWPASMFLAQVYTEGLFIGLSFAAIALARGSKWIPAAILAAAATWTRASGALILIPMGWYWWQSGGLKQLFEKPNWKKIAELLLVVSPIVAYFIWSLIFGRQFHIVESNFFNRTLLAVRNTWGTFQHTVMPAIAGDNLQAKAYYLMEWFGILFGIGASFAMMKRYPGIALYSQALIVFSLTTGPIQGMHRYVMGAPVIFLLPAIWGKNEVFDRAWSLANILWMGILAAIFSYGFFAG